MKVIFGVFIILLVTFALVVGVYSSWNEYSFYSAKYNPVLIDFILREPIERIASYD